MMGDFFFYVKQNVYFEVLLNSRVGRYYFELEVVVFVFFNEAKYLFYYYLHKTCLNRNRDGDGGGPFYIL